MGVAHARTGVVAVVLAVAVLAPAAGAAPPIRDPQTIACPTPPAGWQNPPTGKTVESPQINKNIATLGASDQVIVMCDYFHLPTKHIVVSVNYAIPDDINPAHDFYWGCSSSGTAWNDTDRTFRVMSPDQWAIAAFSDLGGTLKGTEVRAFEQITRRLLRNAEGYAHSCTLKTAPTTLLSNFHYTFDLAAGHGTGSFWVTEPSKPAGPVAVRRVNGVAFTLRVSSSGRLHRLTIRVARGIDFQVARPGVPGRVRLGVSVVSSRVPGCAAGNTGTLTISTKPFVRLAVCGRVFLDGKARTSIQYYY
jgi:hypothetical protein